MTNNSSPFFNVCAALKKLFAFFWRRLEVADGVEALEKIAARRDGGKAPFAVALCDLNMPRMCGDEAVVALRRLEAELKIPRTKVVCVSAFSDDATTQRVMEMGMDLCMHI